MFAMSEIAVTSVLLTERWWIPIGDFYQIFSRECSRPF